MHLDSNIAYSYVGYTSECLLCINHQPKIFDDFNVKYLSKKLTRLLIQVHGGLVSRIIRDFNSVLLYVVKVRGSSAWIGTVCNQSGKEDGLSLPDSALDNFTTMTLTVHRSKMSKNTTKSISAQCALEH